MIIQTFGDKFWIETLVYAFSAIATTTTISIDLAFERTGTILGIQAATSQSSGNQGRPYTYSMQEQATNSVFTAATIGSIFSGLRCRFHNLDTVDTNGATIIVTVFLKKP